LPSFWVATDTWLRFNQQVPKETRMGRPKEPKTTRRLRTRIVPLHIPLQAIQDARSALPHGLRVSDIDCAILLFVERNRNLPFANWPKECRHYKALAKLCRLGYLRQKEWPKSFVITKAGYGMARWILSALEHIGTKPGTSEA
jgi:hypothetical protein